MSGKKIKYSEEVKRKAVEEFNSGIKSVKQLAEELGLKDSNRIYTWKSMYAEQSRNRHIVDKDDHTSNAELLRRLNDLELENNELKKSLGEKSLIIDLLKKMPGNLQYEKNADGLTKTIKELVAKKRHSK